MLFLRKREEVRIARAVLPMKKNSEISHDFNHLISNVPTLRTFPLQNVLHQHRGGVIKMLGCKQC